MTFNKKTYQHYVKTNLKKKLKNAAAGTHIAITKISNQHFLLWVQQNISENIEPFCCKQK